MGSRSAKAWKPYVPEVTEGAIHAFRERNPDLRFHPVVVVIAAYNEEDGIGGVLTGIP